MRRQKPAFLLVLFVLLSLALPILSDAQAGPTASAPDLRSMAAKSGYIFAGTVVRVQRSAPPSGTIETVRITFHVDQPMRGVQAGQIFTIREWAGLWNAGDHYRVGERVVLFLYPTSRLGLTSPVGGRSGHFTVDNKGNVPAIARPSRSNAPQENKSIKLVDFMRQARRAARN